MDKDVLPLKNESARKKKLQGAPNAPPSLFRVNVYPRYNSVLLLYTRLIARCIVYIPNEAKVHG